MVDPASGRGLRPASAFCRRREFLRCSFRDGARFAGRTWSEAAWQQRNETCSRFLFGGALWSRRRPAPPEPLPKEERGGTFRRLVGAADRAKCNACYVLAAMLNANAFKADSNRERRSRPRADL
jgi:hypothetical protein